MINIVSQKTNNYCFKSKMSNIGKQDLIFRMHITSLSQARYGSHLLVRGIHPKYKIIAPNIGDFYDHTLHPVIHKQKVVSQSHWKHMQVSSVYRLQSVSIGSTLALNLRRYACPLKGPSTMKK